jgi:tellurite resistance protein TehA-like permease
MVTIAVSRPGTLESLHPAYFALVMATGILAIACKLLRLEPLPEIFLAINLPAYVLLWGLTLARAARHPRSFFSDFQSHQRAPGFFTMVAATSVVGVQLEVQMHATAAALAMWWLALALWLVLTYTIFTALTIRDDKPSLADGINGGWLTAVVATQSLVVLGTILAPHVRGEGQIASLVLVTLWLAGGMLYIWMISLIFYRYTFFRLGPADLLPPYWINMGAMAISTLAGGLLVRAAASFPLLESLLPFLKGFTLLYWATATWWIPMLLALGAWRYVVHKIPLVYDPLNWGAVFPLAMYTSATYRLGEALELDALLTVARYFVGAALTAWLLTFLGLLLILVRSARRVGRRSRHFDTGETAVYARMERRIADELECNRRRDEPGNGHAQQREGGAPEARGARDRPPHDPARVGHHHDRHRGLHRHDEPRARE